MWTYNYTTELYHYGVPGMKWGVRKARRKERLYYKLARKSKNPVTKAAYMAKGLNESIHRKKLQSSYYKAKRSKTDEERQKNIDEFDKEIFSRNPVTKKMSLEKARKYRKVTTITKAVATAGTLTLAAAAVYKYDKKIKEQIFNSWGQNILVSDVSKHIYI